MKAKDIVWQSFIVRKEQRQMLSEHKSFIIWLTGLSASGKSTIANVLECKLHEMGIRTFLLDGDNVRHGLNRDLGFSAVERKENIRRIAEVAKLFVEAGVVVITSIISPYYAERQMARQMVEKGEFVEVYVKCPLFVCEQRDPKGLYQKARSNKITEFTGVSAPYEEPLNPEIVIETNEYSPEQSVKYIINYLKNVNMIKKKN